MVPGGESICRDIGPLTLRVGDSCLGHGTPTGTWWCINWGSGSVVGPDLTSPSRRYDGGAPLGSIARLGIVAVSWATAAFLVSLPGAPHPLTCLFFRVYCYCNTIDPSRLRGASNTMYMY